MGDWSPLEEDVLLKGLLTVVVHRPDGQPARNQSVKILGCGFVWGGTFAITDADGIASVEAPLGKVEVRVGKIWEEAWVGVDVETVVEITLG
jgi:hypothetical protein